MREVALNEENVPKVRRGEILRYARAGAETEDILSTVIDRYLPLYSYRAVYTELPLSISDGLVELGPIRLRSNTLLRALDGCTSAILVAATVGIEADREVKKLSVTSPLFAHLVDSFGSERIESFLDELTPDIEKELGVTLKPRVSAGYGDIPLSLQREIFDILSPEGKIGLYLSDSLLMTPMKSVTAFIGVKRNK